MIGEEIKGLDDLPPLEGQLWSLFLMNRAVFESHLREQMPEVLDYFLEHLDEEGGVVQHRTAWLGTFFKFKERFGPETMEEHQDALQRKLMTKFREYVNEGRAAIEIARKEGAPGQIVEQLEQMLDMAIKESSFDE